MKNTQVGEAGCRGVTESLKGDGEGREARPKMGRGYC